jgi:hypothetical protein
LGLFVSTHFQVSCLITKTDQRTTMKSLTFSIDLKSLALGAMLAGGLLTLANFKPADKQATAGENGRYQAIVSERSRTIIIDTQTGRFLLERPSMGLPNWAPLDFDELHKQK